jgi:membrane-associated HD superfamily phosphohydrolase
MLSDTDISPPRLNRQGAASGQAPTESRWAMVRAIVLGVLLAAAISAVLLVDLLPSNRVILEAGDVSREDILAPRDLSYESEIRTKLAQDAAAASVPEIFDPPDASIARQQEVWARQILEYVGTVREDPYATTEDKAGWIDAIPDLDLTSSVISQTLTLSTEEWQEAEDETVRVLFRAMQGEIRDNQVPAVRRQVPTFISIRMTDDQAAVVEAFAGSLVAANTFYNAARTEEARQQARDSIAPVQEMVRQGEVIVREGTVVRPLDIEKLDAFELRQQAIRWQVVVANIAIGVIVTILLELVVFRLQPSLWANGRAAAITFLLIAIFAVLSKLMLPVPNSIVPLLYPLPALSMLLSILSGPALGLAVGVIVGLLGHHGVPARRRVDGCSKRGAGRTVEKFSASRHRRGSEQCRSYLRLWPLCARSRSAPSCHQRPGGRRRRGCGC